jgi:hypothetical protein
MGIKGKKQETIQETIIDKENDILAFLATNIIINKITLDEALTCLESGITEMDIPDDEKEDLKPFVGHLKTKLKLAILALTLNGV